MNNISKYKKSSFLFQLALALTLAIASFTSCSKEETYAEQRERELNNISKFIAKEGISVIDEKTFKNQGYTTEENQYVLFNNTGVYMNIVDKGPEDGIQLTKAGDHAEVLVRFSERNLNGDSIQCTNFGLASAIMPDKFTVHNYSGTYYATFVYGRMVSYYGSTSVPGGWLVPLRYIRLGRSEHSTVRLIVPHDQGTARASSGVYACFYYLKYLLDR